MRYSIFLDYWNAITPIEAQNALTMVEVSSFSHIKESDRKKVLGRLRKLAYNSHAASKELSMEEAAKALAESMGRG